MPTPAAPALAALGQFVFDFFAPEPAEATPKKEAAQADLALEIEENTLENVPIKSEPEPAPAATRPAHLGFAHPQATHRMVLAQEAVAYQLVRSQRRSVGFVVQRQGLQVRAPRWVSLAEIEKLLHKRANWVLTHWRQQQARPAAPNPQTLWAFGSQHGWCGLPMTLVSRPDLPAKQHQRQGDALQLALPAAASSAAIERAALDWYSSAAYALFTERLNHYAAPMGVQWRSLRLSSAKTRWGSAKSDGSIRLHWRLAQLAPELLDYVVIHELAHLHEMNHSPRFWAIVHQHCPNYLALRKALRAHDLAAP